MKVNYKHQMARSNLHLIVKFSVNSITVKSRPYTHVLKLISKSENCVFIFNIPLLFSVNRKKKTISFSFRGTANFNPGRRETLCKIPSM